MTDNLFSQVGKSSRSDPNFSAHRPLTIIFSSDTPYDSRSYAVHSKTSGNLPCPQIKHHAMSRDSEVWRFRRLFNSPSGELPGISPISSLERVTWQLQVDQKTKAKGRRKRRSDPGLLIDQGKEMRWRTCDYCSQKSGSICKAICTYGKGTAPTLTGHGFFSN